MIFLKRFAFALLALFLFVLSVVSLPNKKANVATVSAVLKENPVIIIDAGHGGFDGGAVANDGTAEKNINLNIALTLGNMLSLNGIKVIYTRTEDTGTETNESESIRNRKRSDLNNRLNIMKENPEALFVSIHLNKFTTVKANGAQVFYSGNFEDSQVLGNFIQQNIKEQLQQGNNRVIKKATDDAFLLYNATVPAVIVECGFLSNTAELELLKTNDYQCKMAFAVFCGILNFFGR